MTEHTAALPQKPRWITPMRSCSPDEVHRAATPLELFFDLVFVVAVAQAGSRLHHGLAEAHIAEAIASYAMVFFAIWWAWMNFTWFASAYDTDDVPYRLAVFVQLTGALILAAGIPAAFDEHNFTLATIGYVVMRLPLVAQWLRAAVAVPVVIYLTGLWALHQQPHLRSYHHPLLFPLSALLILLTPLSGQAVLLTGLLLTALVVIKMIDRYRTPS